MDENINERVETSGVPGWVVAVLAIAVIIGIGGVGFGWYDYNAMNASQQAADGQLKTMQQDAAQKLAALDKRITDEDATATGLQSDLGVVTKKLKVTEGELVQARSEAAKIRQDSEQKIADLNNDVNTQLATKATNDDLHTVSGNVDQVKGDLASTKSDLNMARSELGTLIARNHEEIDVLRRMGERDYTEFTISGKNKPQKVGSFTAELRSADPKKNKFTVALVVNDVRTEKKDRNVDEPIVIYPAGTHDADEFVVNSVTKDQIKGYISTPKNPGLTSASAAPPSGN